MAGIKLEWAQFGDFDSFDVLRSGSPMDVSALPSPLVTGLLTMYYADESITDGATYYYRVRAWRNGLSQLSSEIRARASTGDEYWDNAVALLHFDGNLDDVKGHTFTPYNSISYPAGQFGTSILLSGGAYLDTSASSDFGFGDGDFTVEFFIDAASNSGYGCIFDNRQTGTGCAIYVYDSNQVVVTSNTAIILQKNFSGTGFKHVAVCRQSGVIYLFVDGVLLGTVADARTYAASTSLSIGRSTTGQYLNARLDELRITRGISRYSGNFTPPVQAFPGY